MTEKPLVSIVKADEEMIENAVYKSIDLIDGLSDLKGRKTVSIKPNLCRPSSSQSGCTTDPKIVEAVIRKVNCSWKCDIQIVETNNFIASADETFRRLGYADLANKYPNVNCKNLSKEEKLRVSINGEIFKTIRVPESMIFSDYIINAAKLKTHVDYYYTGVLKNAYGFLSSPTKRSSYHGFMHEALVDLNTLYKPDLAIIDGIVGLEGFGPVDGKPKYVGVIIASKDPVAADSVGAEIAGFKPSKIKYLKYAEKKGLGKMKNLEIVGCSLEEVKTHFDFIPLKWYYLGKLSLTVQRFSKYLSNFARLLSLSRSAMSTIGYSDLSKRLSKADLMNLAKDTVFKITD
jgi:uncharacterized protein (DUF362 family)